MKWWTTYSTLKIMRRRLSWSAEELAEFRHRRLRELVKWAYLKSPFYRQFYDQGNAHPEDVNTIEDLKRLPLLEKEQLQRTDPLQVVTLPADTKWRMEITSGSTGEPLHIYRTWRDLAFIKAKVIRAFQQTGFRFYQRQVVLKSSAASLSGRHWFENFGILRKYWLAVGDPPAENLRRLRKIRPQHLHGYPSGLADIAEYMKSHDLSFRIPIICVGAEVLDDPTRKCLEQTFQAQVFDLYASREVGNVAWECRAHQGLHVNDDALIVELLDEEGREVPDGTEGEVVVTFLDGYDYPFLRYRLGDCAVRLSGSCPCGVAFSRLEKITGRSDSRILLPSGRWISGLVFQELRTTPWVAAFRIIQEERASLRLQVVPKSPVEPEVLQSLVAQTADLVHHELKVLPEVLPKLDREASGKLRTVICHLPEAQPQMAAGSFRERL